MESLNQIESKLEKFIKRYYLSAVIRGVLLFFGFGVLYILFWVIVESFFWLPSIARGLIFWCIIGFEAVLFYNLIVVPALRYLKIRKPIDSEKAAALIGESFPEIKDKLLNVIQLGQQQKTELVLASINKRALQFSPFSFERAVNLKENLKHLKYALAPLLILAPFYLFGEHHTINNSFKRVVDYSTSFAPPPPFRFKILNKTLNTIEGKSFDLVIKTEGDVLPEDAQIQFNDELYFLKKLNKGFSYQFLRPYEDLTFELISGKVRSNPHTLKVIKAPKILGTKLKLDYPAYTKRKSETIANFGNVSVPEGTKMTWTLLATATDTVSFYDTKALKYFKRKKKEFIFSQPVFSFLKYRIATNNSNLKNYETLQFNAEVIKDLPPTIDVKYELKKTPEEQLFFYGHMKDDYGITALKLNYYPRGKEALKQTIDVVGYSPETLRFSFVFPLGLDLKAGVAYELYFEVFDNDPFPKPNRTKSAVFLFQNKSQETLNSERLETQEQTLLEVEKSFSNSESQRELEFLKQQQQKKTLSFNDREKIKALLERQSQQDAVLKNFNQKIQETLDQTPVAPNDKDRNELKKRLEAQNKQLERDEKNMEALKKLAKDLDKEDLLERTGKLMQQNKAKARSMAQMLELTKRYYVTQKAKQIKNKLEDLSRKQQQLSKESLDQNTLAKQSEINKKFQDLKEMLETLRAKNQALSKPINLPDTQKEETAVQEDQAEAKTQLQQKELSQDTDQQTKLNSKASKSQQKAAKKMSQIAGQMAQKMAGGSQQQMQEDSQMLRQILDNLLLFSFEQEALMRRFGSSQNQQMSHAKNLITQKNIKTHFEHIDDSLFVVSLRQPMISEKVNKEISEVYYNIDKTLTLFADGRIYQAASAQQYALTAANNLADLLSNFLNSMELQMSQGQGQGDMQLPDIIMSQEDLQKQAEESQGNSGESPMSRGGSKSEEKGEQQGEGEGKTEQPNKPGQSPGPSDSSKNSGPSGDGTNAARFFDNEESSQALMELYKKQQDLRRGFEQLLKEKGMGQAGEGAVKSMKKIEQTLINQGVSSEVLREMQALKYQFLKLKDAIKKQGQESKRQSKTNTARFTVTTENPVDQALKKQSTKEDLKRQSLPLRQEYFKRVQDYFNLNYDPLYQPDKL